MHSFFIYLVPVNRILSLGTRNVLNVLEFAQYILIEIFNNSSKNIWYYLVFNNLIVYVAKLTNKTKTRNGLICEQGVDGR